MSSDNPTAGGQETLVIVGCGSAKRSRNCRYEARELYTSTYFEKKREYAETVGDQWAILSAEHGLIAPTEQIKPYETSIDDLDDRALDELAHEVGMDLIDWIHYVQTQGVEVDRVVVLAGKRYLEPLRERETFDAGPEVAYPLQQKDLGGIGEQMSWLNERSNAADTQQQRLITDGGRETAEVYR